MNGRSSGAPVLVPLGVFRIAGYPMGNRRVAATAPAQALQTTRSTTPVSEQRCAYCTRPVLVAFLNGCAVSLELREIECPRMPCPSCTTRTGKHKGRVGPCERCEGTGIVGVRVPNTAIGLALSGRARHWDRSMRRLNGECLHKPHVCA